MKRKRSLVFAAACAALCALCVVLYGQQLQDTVDRERAEALERYGGEQVEVRVATRDIAVGERLDDTNSVMRPWISDMVPEGAVMSLDDVASRPASALVVKGEVVCVQRFAPDESAALQVPEGMCAVSVPAKPVAMVGGSVGPGSRVDVYATSGTATDVLARNVQVLSTSASESGDTSGGIAWITLSVEPAQVEEFVAAAERTELYFALPSESVSIDYAESVALGLGELPHESNGEAEKHAAHDGSEAPEDATSAEDDAAVLAGGATNVATGDADENADDDREEAVQ